MERRGCVGRGRGAAWVWGGWWGLAGIAEAHGGKRGEEGESDAAVGGDEEDKLGLFSLDDLVDLSQHDAPEADMEMEMDDGENQMEPPPTPLLHASPAPAARIVHVHHHHHHHHYAPTVRSVSVPPGEAPEDGLGLGVPLGLMSAPATPALGAAATLAPPSAFALDPTLLGLPQHRGNMNAANTLHATLMGPGGGHGHGDGMYDLPFLDLHYFGGGAGAQQMQMQMQLEGWRGGEALDLARSTSSGSTVPAQQSFAPSAFSFAQPRTPQAQTVSVSQAQAQAQAQTGAPPPPGVWKALGIPASLRQHIPPRPLMRRASAGPPGVVGIRALGAGAGAASSGGGARSASHHRGQSAVVRPQDLVLGPESAPAAGSGPKGKRKRASWDGGGW
ncbi:hypothetical protein B0H12DRAFT_541052 [Mycena haematopus]|nr:hypothetical protein B0H12DRAFT_541052 [Mycena haematopus]